ncbi:MerR family transcriptional regulator [Campylobacter sp. MIT 12-5580]|uniref:MerR family transcriptional regulator n=1 Tax=Campylobacter sp. MIT 12-5580 TaxID=2040651 RepID=UPI0010F49779|nr:MerR family transcriptional regulator [Campylobacter sp. MIT 12-5580]TKX29596.1 MerR family transcriptional regulator [Campylobacter sp. MIT 12-5580]
MAYTIKEVEKLTGVSAHTIRYWAKRGLFSHIQRDENNVRYFSQRDLQWVALAQCMRETGMSIAKISEFVELCKLGDKSIPARLKMIKEQEKEILSTLESYTKALKVVQKKISFYEEVLAKEEQDKLTLGQDERLRNYYQEERDYQSLKDHASAKKKLARKEK